MIVGRLLWNFKNSLQIGAAFSFTKQSAVYKMLQNEEIMLDTQEITSNTMLKVDNITLYMKLRMYLSFSNTNRISFGT